MEVKVRGGYNATMLAWVIVIAVAMFLSTVVLALCLAAGQADRVIEEFELQERMKQQQLSRYKYRRVVFENLN